MKQDDFTPASKADLRHLSGAIHDLQDKINRLEWMLSFAAMLLMLLVAKLIFGFKLFWE